MSKYPPERRHGPSAVHLPGSNLFSGMRIDVSKSIAAQEPWLATAPKKRVRRPRWRSWIELGRYVLLRKLGIWEALVESGLIRGWFKEFDDYWCIGLGGRTISVPAFHAMLFRLRERFFDEQLTLDWNNSESHLASWQQPQLLYNTFQFLHRQALNPVRSRLLFSLLHSGMRVLEFGCSIAPMYRTWRSFLSHVPTRWVLADIPGFSFHCARHCFGQDADCEFLTISPELFSDPLRECEGTFDLIIVQEVFEHLQHPRKVAEALLSRLTPGGLFYFDYIVSDAQGLDTPTGLSERKPTLEYLSTNLEIIRGDFWVDGRSLLTCVGKKRSQPAKS